MNNWTRMAVRRTAHQVLPNPEARAVSHANRARRAAVLPSLNRVEGALLIGLAPDPAAVIAVRKAFAAEREALYPAALP